jgi:hypothetical protein
LVRIDGKGDRYVSTSDLVIWINNLHNAIESECLGVPAGCDETRAYLYGELCSIRIFRKQFVRWNEQAVEGQPQEPLPLE